VLNKYVLKSGETAQYVAKKYKEMKLYESRIGNTKKTEKNKHLNWNYRKRESEEWRRCSLREHS
jgi:hypothetical protein